MTIEEMRSIKETRGYSFKMLSSYTGIPAVTLQKVLSGKTTHPRQATLDAIERVLSAPQAKYQGKAFMYSMESTDCSFVAQEAAAVYTVGKEDGYTAEDFRALPEDRRCELINGRLIRDEAPSPVHQEIVSLIHMTIYEYIQKSSKKCRVFESINVRLKADENTIVVPDLIVLCDLTRLKSTGVCGAPDFVLEVLSPSTRKTDLTLKLEKYASAGVREYWIIDPTKKMLISYDFTDETFIPLIRPLKGKAPFAITGGEMLIDLDTVAGSIRELEGI